MLALHRGFVYIRHTDGWSKVWLYTDPQFLPKTKKGLEGVVQGIPIISLQDRVDSLEPNYTLCPVRCLRYYLDRTSNVTIHKGRNRLLLPFKPEILTELSASGLNNLFCKAIQTAYNCIPEESSRIHKVNIHQARLLSHSLKAMCGVSLENILRSGHWTTPSTFTTFYLRSLRVIKGDLYTLGPLSVAGEQVTPTI